MAVSNFDVAMCRGICAVAPRSQEACTAPPTAVLDGVMRLDSWASLWVVPGAWSASCAG